MKKVLYGVALTLLASVSVGSLQSCKDDVNDLKTQTSFDLAKLKLDVDAAMKKLQDQITENRTDIDQLLRDINNYATLSYVNKLIYGSDKGGVEFYDPAIGEDGLLGMINGALSRLDTVDGILFPEVKPEDYGNSKNMIDYLNGKLGAQKETVDQILKFLDYELDPEKEGYQTLSELFQGIQDQLDELTNEEGNGRVDVLETKVNEIENQIKAIINNNESLVTGILIQRTWSPVFGDFSLPIGVQSNLLFNWYGYNDYGADFTFPSSDSSNSATGEVGVIFNGASEPIQKGYYYEDVELGDVYVTLNPLNHKFDNTKVTVVNSKGEALVLEDLELVPSDKLLSFGYTKTRADEDIESVLYKGTVKVKATAEDHSSLDAVKVVIKDQLKDAVKDAVKNPTKRNAAALLKAVYDQMAGLLPAYALRYDWTAPYTSWDADNKATTADKKYSVLSQFDLGVATAQPIGFNFLKDVQGSGKVPVISNLDNFVAEILNKNLISLEGQEITLDGGKYKVGFGKVSFRTVKKNNYYTALMAKVEGLTLNDKPILTEEFEIKKLQVYNEAGTEVVETIYPTERAAEVINENIKKAIVEEIEALSGKTIDVHNVLMAEINSKVDLATLELSAQINEVVKNLNGQIKDSFTSMGEEAETYINKVNRVIDLYNKVANKINNVLKYPNHYLQAAAFYEGGNNMGILSSDPENPTVFKAAGGSAINVFLSTYTGEIVAPAYKKYVAVTGVVGNANADVASLNGGELNKVLDGSRIRVKVPVAGFESGKVYEFTYQALDYCGYTSTKKFYIQINK